MRIAGKCPMQHVALGVICVCLAIGVSGATNAVAAPAGELTFDPVLSLTGGCGTSEIDPVADPGCPGGKHPPGGTFTLPRSITTDSHGDIYVASYGNESGGTFDGLEGRIDIFDPSGNFLTEIPDSSGPKNIAVDSKGNLYVFQFRPAAFQKVERYKPSGAYNPAAGEIKYETPPELVVKTLGSLCGLAVDRQTDHLFVHLGVRIQEFSSAENGNEPLDSIGEGSISTSQTPQGRGLAVDSARGLIYASDQRSASPQDFLIDAFELEAPHDLVQRFDGAATPSEKFSSEPSVAVDEGSGSFFVYPPGKTVYEFTDDGTLADEIEHEFKEVFGAEIGVDSGAESPNAGYLFVPSHPVGIGHSFAFGPQTEGEPKVESLSFANVSEAEAELLGSIEPFGLPTEYTFEITPAQRYEDEGFTGALVARQGQLPAGHSPAPVFAALSGLLPGTAYRFRLSATNELGNDAAEGEFKTYPPAEPILPCANDAFRNGFSKHLPDCRAYELVTPPGTNARSPRGLGVPPGAYFATREVSPAGEHLSFITEGGALPGSEGTGSLGGDPYLTSRGATGWSTSSAGPTGSEAPALHLGGVSPDQGYSFWSTGGGKGSAAIEEKDTAYVRYPDGHSELVGRGSIDTDPQAQGKLISENGSHIVFWIQDKAPAHSGPAIQLEPNAPPEGTEAVYDRTADEVTHVVSLLPEDKSPKAGEDAEYVGASLDGRGVAFEIAGKLYLRYNNEETYELGEGLTFAGIAEGGAKAFYLEGGKLWRFDATTEERTEFASVSVTPVNVSSNGNVAYFVSKTVLTGEPNPNGAVAKGGEENLYRSEEGAISFVGTVTEEDVIGEETGIGLGRWTPHVVSYGEAAEDPSRSTPDGGVLLFESRADLAGYDPKGHTQVYRYDSSANELTCLSCIPTGAPVSSGATLQSMGEEIADPIPLGPFVSVTNLRADGRRVFFQSTEPLVPTDTNGLQDVYEWEAQAVGSCTRAEGCVYLISSGQGKRVNYLYAVSDSGDDVFFRSSDLLVSTDLEETPSIYDARVGGGFPEEGASECEGEGCRPGLPAPPPMIAPESGVRAQPAKGKTCPKGKRKVRRNGKVRCVKKKHHRKHHRHRASSKQKGAGK